MAETKRQPERQVVYLSVTGDDIVKLVPMLRDTLGWDIPYPAFTSAEIALCDGKIIGVTLLHLQPTIGPMWVASDHRGSGVAEHLADRIAATAKGARMEKVMCQTQSEFVKEMCRARGMKEKGQYTVFVSE